MKSAKRIFVLGTILGFATMAEARPSIQKPVVCTPALFDCQPLIMLPDMDECPKKPETPQVADGGSPIDQTCKGRLELQPVSASPGTEK